MESMYCPRCGYNLAGLPKIHRCPECQFIYIAKVTTAAYPRPARSWRHAWVWLAVPLALIPVGISAYWALNNIFGDSGSRWFDSGSGSNDPVVARFEAWFGLFLVAAVVMAGVSAWSGRARFWIRHEGIGWLLRGDIKQVIPWSIVTRASLASSGKTVMLALSIGGTIELPRHVFRKGMTPSLALTLINLRMNDYTSGIR